MSFESPNVKLTIGSYDEPDIQVTAQYNPKELQIDKQVPWQKHNKGNANGLQLEFTGADGREVTVELFFDGYETGDSVQDEVDTLETLASVRDPTSQDDEMRRPHHCIIAWGDKGLPSFLCVIETLSTKYSMFLPDGTPVRATVSVKLKEAQRVSMAAENADGSTQTSGTGSANGSGTGTGTGSGTGTASGSGAGNGSGSKTGGS